MTFYGWLRKYIDEHENPVLADSNCRYCHGGGMEANFEGYPMPMPVYCDVCRCVWERIAYVEYFERPEMDYDKKPDNWSGIWIPF